VRANLLNGRTPAKTIDYRPKAQHWRRTDEAKVGDSALHFLCSCWKTTHQQRDTTDFPEHTDDQGAEKNATPLSG
jgi:hypothetical protein